MRITIDPKLGGVVFDPQVTPVKVMLDGKMVKYCICADSDKGEVVVLGRDAKGEVMGDNGMLRYQTLNGRVHIDFHYS